MMRKSIVFGTLILLMSMVMVAAQPGPEPKNAPSPLRLLVRYLQLDEGQVEQIKWLVQSQKEAIGALREQLSPKQQAYQDLINSANPNPTDLGNLALEIHGLRQQIAAARDATKQSFEGLLLDEQKRRLGALQRAARLQPIVEAAKKLGFI